MAARTGAIVEAMESAAPANASPTSPLFVLVGVSGVGKDTLLAELVSRRGLRRPISATTREPRHGEENGRDYHFFAREEFERRAAAGEFLEWAEFDGQLYGTLRSELASDDGTPVLCIRENQGARRMQEELGAIVVGVLAPSQEAVVERMRARGDSPEKIATRVQADAEREREIVSFADYLIVNDDFERARDELEALVARFDPRFWGAVRPRSLAAHG
jgi:guanylate kinase